MEKQRVVIVAQGTFGIMEDKDYVPWIETMVRTIEAAQRTNRSTGQKVPAAEVEVVPTIAVLHDKLRTFPRPNVVIFRTRGMLETAKTIKRTYRDVRVIVFTGALPDDEVVLVSKTWVLDLDSLRSVILD